ncbi:MAG: ComF family protein [Betaproteobacteria bacterium]|nr:ComF family protein [Betaproteobacteria bacterium]
MKVLLAAPFFCHVFLHHCAACKAACRRTACGGCRADIARLAGAARCPQCAAPAAGICGACLREPPAFDQTVAALHYAPPLAALVRDFKFHGKWQLARFLAEFTRPPEADLMLPVPLFPAREQWRGFNQARELARFLPPPAPPRNDILLQRVADTRPQSQLPNAAARRKNMRGAFFAAPAVRGKTVLVVDDVMSSGATLNETARALKKAGAAKVINLVIARASFI